MAKTDQELAVELAIAYLNYKTEALRHSRPNTDGSIKDKDWMERMMKTIYQIVCDLPKGNHD